MIYISDLQNLVSSWLERLGDSSQPLPYRDALNECIYDLNNLIDHSLIEEADYQDMLESWNADNYLSSLEAHEAVA